MVKTINTILSYNFLEDRECLTEPRTCGKIFKKTKTF